MKAFLTATTILEGTVGIILLIVPSVFISFLLGATLNEPGGILARLTGVALISVSVACWSYRHKTQQSSGICNALIFYNMGASSLLIYSYIAGFSGMGLLPAVVQHVVFGIWGILLFRK